MVVKKVLFLSAFAATLSSPAFAGFAVNLSRTGGNTSPAPAAALSDFITQNPDSGLVTGDTFFEAAGGLESNFDPGPQSLGGFTVSASAGATGSIFDAGSNAHNDLNPITESYAFNQEATITIAGLMANSVAGDTIVLSIFAIGDNIGQQSTLTANYGGASATQSTLFNGAGEARTSAVGSIPFVNFTFVADGVTDAILFDINGASGTGGGVLNGFSLSVTPAVVPEPASLALIGLGSLALVGRRRKA